MALLISLFYLPLNVLWKVLLIVFSPQVLCFTLQWIHPSLATRSLLGGFQQSLNRKLSKNIEVLGLSIFTLNLIFQIIHVLSWDLFSHSTCAKATVLIVLWSKNCCLKSKKCEITHPLLWMSLFCLISPNFLIVSTWQCSVEAGGKVFPFVPSL